MATQTTTVTLKTAPTGSILIANGVVATTTVSLTGAPGANGVGAPPGGTTDGFIAKSVSGSTVWFDGSSVFVPRSTVTTKGDLLAASGSGTLTRLAAGADQTLLRADSTQASGLSFASMIEAAARGLGWASLDDPRYANADLGIAWNNCVAALGSAGGRITGSAAAYSGSTVPTLASKIVFLGNGENATTLLFTGGGFSWSTDISKLRFEHVNLKSTNGDLFAPTSTGGMHQSTFKHCVLQNIDGHSIWDQVNGISFQEMTFEDCEFSSDSTATTPAFNIVNSAGAANGNRFLRCRANGANNTHRPFFHIESSSTTNYAYDNRFEDIIGEQNPGGLVRLLSAANSEVRNVQDYDATSAYTGDVVRVDKSATGGLASKWVKVAKSGRRGGTLGGSVYDVNIGNGLNSGAVNCIAEQNNYSTGAVTTLYSPTTAVIGEGTQTNILPRSSLFVRPSSMVLAAGSPTLVLDDTFVPVWSFLNGADSSVAFQEELPSDWSTYTIDLRWLNGSTGTGNVRWQIFVYSIANGSALPGNTNTTQVVAAGSQNVPQLMPWVTTALTAPAAGGTVAVGVKRVGTNGTDTLANAAHLLGVYLRKFS